MNQRSEQMVLDYLSEVGMALYGRMTAKERTAYLTRLRSKIDERRAVGPDDVGTVRGILRSFGSPQDLVERDCGGQDLDLEDNELLPPKPQHAHRPPPPWRGGPNRGFMALLEGPGQTDMNLHRKKTGRPRGLREASLVARTHPAEVIAITLLLLVVPWWWDLAFVWVLGAVLIVLSQVWNAVEKWFGVGLPLVGCVLGMALWNGETKFLDQYIQESLSTTGVIGLGLGSLVSVLHLVPRLLRSVRTQEIRDDGR